MRKFTVIALLVALLATAPLSAQQAEKQSFPSPNEIVDKAAAEEWIAIAPTHLLVMNLAPDAQGKERRVIIQLMPDWFNRGHLGNIRKLALAHWWDGTSINRVQDNYVVQWGDASEKKQLPGNLVTVAEKAYEYEDDDLQIGRKALEMERPVTKVLRRDPYAPYTDFEEGWPFAADLKNHIWPIHCYGAVGVGRGYSPNTGSGAELYTVIGHAPRHLDRNIAVVGRIIEGIEHLSSLPRGTGPLGFYEKAEQRVTIKSIRLASELAKADQPRFEYLDTNGKSFTKYAEARANRRDPFFIKPAGGADICNIPVPVRRVKVE